MELWPIPIYFTSNVKGKLINASLACIFLGDTVSSVISIIISLVFCIYLFFFSKAVKCTEKQQKSQLWVVNSAAQTQKHRRLHAASIFPGIAARQTGKKNDQHALLTPQRSESYTQGCGYYLSSSKSACLVIIRAWDRNLS